MGSAGTSLVWGGALLTPENKLLNHCVTTSNLVVLQQRVYTTT